MADPKATDQQDLGDSFAAFVAAAAPLVDVFANAFAAPADYFLALGAALAAEEYDAKAQRRTGSKRRKALRQARAQRADLTRIRQRIAARERDNSIGDTHE